MGRVHCRRRLFDGGSVAVSEGWDWVQREKIGAPLYWHGDGTQFTLAGRREIDRAAPVAHVSYYEADAFARWSGARLPTEAEWEDFAGIRRSATSATSSTGPEPSSQARWRHLRRRVGMDRQRLPSLPPLRTGRGRGRRIQWQVHERPVRAARARAARPRAGHSRASYRNFFPPSARWQFTGVRLARDAERVDPAFREDVLAGLDGADPGGAGALALRPARFRAVRRDHPAAGLLSDPDRDGAAHAIMPDIASRIPSGTAVVEFGAGSATKTPLLLEAIRPAAYVPVDISGDYLRESAADIAAQFPSIAVSRLSRISRDRSSFRPASPICPSSASSPARPSAISSRAARPTSSAVPRPARRRLAIADRHGPGEAGRATDRRL